MQLMSSFFLNDKLIQGEGPFQPSDGVMYKMIDNLADLQLVGFQNTSSANPDILHAICSDIHEDTMVLDPSLDY